jgi:hypothetical protein
MYSLYRRLFRYRERSERSPLEDFLSESLADIFNRLASADKIGFISRLLLPPGKMEALLSLVAATDIIRMETQYSIPSGRLDIAVLFGSDPVFVIENKIGSPVAQRHDGSDQLATYGRWLKGRADESGQGLAVICLLTHTTKAPSTFSDGRLDVYESIPKILHWSEVAGELRQMAQSETLRWDVRTLAHELHHFLLGEDMTSEAPRLEDFAAAIVYVKAGTRVSNAFQNIYEHLCQFGAPFSKGSILDDCSLDFDSTSSVMQGWKYFSSPPLKTAYFAYGIALQPRLNLPLEAGSPSDAIPAEDSLFLYFGVETKKEIALHSTKLPSPWQLLPLIDLPIAIVFRPLSTVLGQPETFADTMKEWIDQVMPDVLSVAAGMPQA